MLLKIALGLLAVWLVGVLGVYDIGDAVHIFFLVGGMLLLLGVLSREGVRRPASAKPRGVPGGTGEGTGIPGAGTVPEPSPPTRMAVFVAAKRIADRCAVPSYPRRERDRVAGGCGSGSPTPATAVSVTLMPVLASLRAGMRREPRCRDDSLAGARS